MQIQLNVENIRCGGCTNTITKRLLAHETIESVRIEIDKQLVIIDSTSDVRDIALQTLADLGYPERGTVTGLASVKEKAKSLVSCAIGRVGPQARS